MFHAASLETSNNTKPMSQERTFGFDDDLPRLPIPELEHSMDLYLQSIIPHCNSQEYQQTRALTREFQENQGRQLQERLKEKFKHSKNWLEEYWLNETYLRMRHPVLPSMCMVGLPFSYLCEPKLGNGYGFKYASLHIYFSMVYWQQLRKETILPDKSRKGERMSMHQNRYLFNSNRLPGEHVDKVTSYFRTEDQGDCPSDFLIICNSHLYILETMDASGDICTPPEIQAQLKMIWEKRDNKGCSGVGALTSEHRREWWKLRQHLRELHEENSENLSSIERAVAVVVLKDAASTTREQMLREAFVGNVMNRWAEKSNTVIVWTDGQMASSFDHTNMDGIACIYHSEFVATSCKPYIHVPWPHAVPHRPPPRVRRLNFVVDKEIRSAIQAASHKAKSRQNELCVKILNFKEIGKQKLKLLKASPDSFVQASIQLAYYKLHARAGPTYETATTRSYFRGRTETCRTCSQELLQFCSAVIDTQTQKMVKSDMLRRVLDKHVELMRLCSKGYGLDRHLLGLKLIAKEEGQPMPRIFQDPVWIKSGGDSKFALSTSTGGYTDQCWGGLPICQDGYGVYYCIADSSINFVLTSYRDSDVTDLKRYGEALDWAMNENVQLLKDHPTSGL